MTADEVELIEGRARIRLPAADRSTRGPESKETSTVFYNPAMALNRDLSSLLLTTRAQDGWHVLDGLAASGVRGLRYALECGAQIQLEANDWNPLAAALLQRNAEVNGVDAHVTSRNLSALLHESVWHVVDVDPFGSPAPFLDGATRAVRDGGLLGLTATDTTALAGVYPNVCRRRYMATPLHGEIGHEVALRILAASATRHAAKHDLALTPILAHATDHYYRVTLGCRRGAARADEALRHVGVIHYCPACGDRGYSDAKTCPACGAPVRISGPAWTGALVDPTTAAGMLGRADAFPFAHAESRALLDLLAAEAGSALLPFDIHEAGSRARVGSPPTALVLAALRDAGYQTVPVHHNRLAIRTDAPAKEMERIVREASGA